MRNTFKNLTASGTVIPGEGVLMGMYVNSTASGSMVLYNNLTEASNSGVVIGGTIAPGIGYHNLGGIYATAGVYCVINETLDVTFHILESE